MTKETRHWVNEPDIGSGEKSPAQQEIEDEVGSVETGDGADKPQGAPPDETGGGRILQSGTHLARILAVPQNNGSYEAQVYVRLTREPEVAETYIPAGTFPTEAEAWSAAEERARRALAEHEF